MIQANVSIKHNLPSKTVVKRFYQKFYIIASLNWKDLSVVQLQTRQMFCDSEN